ncbi:MAG: S1/P1 nuclease [Cyclobacteriaceae bacterium]
MKKLVLLFLCCHVFYFPGFGWGQIGHRVVGQIAEWHLNKKAQKRIASILGAQSLAMASTWMDEIKSDSYYDHLNTWHYLTVEEGKGYRPEIQEERGDAFGKTNMIIQALKNGKLTVGEEQEYLKMLIHLVGDLHQPLHVGTGTDRGGNDVKVTYFNANTNLHAIWDSKVIDSKQLSFTELARHLNFRADKNAVKKYQLGGMELWLEEAVSLRPLIYNLPENKRLFYEYGYKTFPVMEERLLAGGLRLAGILNEIYG